MERKFVETESFRKSWRAMGMNDDELRILQELILIDPQRGDVIPETGGARKMRIQMEGRGKRGGARVIYVDIFEAETIYLLLAYPKNVQEDLTDEQKKAIRKLVLTIKAGG